jgi:murein L,D-transpeptidase YafK
MKPKTLPACAVFVFVGLFFNQAVHAERISTPPKFIETSATTPEQAKTRLLKQLSKKGIVQLPLAEPKIVIEKSKHTLFLYNGALLVKSFPVSLGRVPHGQKEHQGDYRTPDGTFHISKRNDNSDFHLFMGLNYPNGTVADQAFNQKAISKAMRDRIIASERNKTTPPWDSPLGGAVGIHGIGKGQGLARRYGKDWTAGCIALTDRDIEELWVATDHWTPVEIKE